jgi:cobalt/nickel transport system permease protein
MRGSLAAVPFVDSPAARLDTRWRLAGLTALIIATAMSRTVLVAGVELILAVLLTWWACVPALWCRARLWPVLLLLLPAALVLPFSWYETATAWKIGPLFFSPERGRLTLLIFVKATALVLLVQIILVSDSLTTTLKAAHHLHVPGLVVQLVMLSYRYVYLLGDELNRLRIGLRIRGFRNRPSRHGYRTVGHLAGALLLRGYERAERVGQAMTCRGYQGRFHALTQFRTSARDVCFFLLLAAACLGLTALDWYHAHG